MPTLPFDLLNNPPTDPSALRHRPRPVAGSFAEDARRFVPGRDLEVAINTAIAVGEPLLITGEAGTGKTQAAYYAAYRLGIEPVHHFQAKSDSTAHDLLYHFDTVRYFHDANLRREPANPLNKADYVEKRALWEVMESGETVGHPRVLLIDEIDKAPRDFPNDLLHELNRMEFTVVETGETVRADPSLRPILFITSNSERRLPEPFLRRCVYHHIRFDEGLLRRAVETHREDFPTLSDGLLELALQRFLALRQKDLRKRAATGEMLVWLRVLGFAVERDPGKLEDALMSENLRKLPYLGVLLKDHRDMEEV